MDQIYYIHDNCSRPFKVIINDNNDVSVYNNFSNELIFSKKVNKIFIGCSPKNKMTKFSGGYGKEFNGNSILLEIDDNTYQYIGSCIYTFNTYSKIINYISPVGNSDVPYPYAIDYYGNMYLLIEGIVLINTDFFKNTYKDYDDPYDYYYDNILITNDMGFVSPKEPKIRNYTEFKDYNNIREFYINNESYSLTYGIHKNIKDTDIIKIVLNDNTEKILTKDEFKTFNENFGLTIGFRPIMNKIIDYERL